METLANNIDSHFSKIPFNDLPKTIQDAVRICLALGIYYLWVDALCIVQDDENDWASECMRMGDIYSGAYVTLAAVQGHHSEAGLLRVKPFKVARIKVWPPTGSPTKAFVYRQLQHRYPNRKLHKQHLEQRPLLTRGWVYQELLLSPRVLRFDADELSFECREGMMCECGLPPDVSSNYNFIKTLGHDKATRSEMESDPNSLVCDTKQQFAARRKDFSLVENGILSHPNAFRLWYGMVEQYSSMTLTKQSDRLPAFSAIASKFSRYGGKYYAGVWQNDFISGLEWFRPWNPLRPATRGSDHLTSVTESTPSWSWASQPDSVHYHGVYHGYLSYTAKISIKSLDLSNEANIFGGVSSGYLDASGLLKPAKLSLNSNHDKPWEGPYKLYRHDESRTDGMVDRYVTFYPDCGIPCELEAKMLRTPNSVYCFLLTRSHCDNDEKYEEYEEDEGDEKGEEDKEDKEDEEDKKDEDWNHEFSLVLGLVDEKQQLYRRIGFMNDEYRGRSWFDDAKEARILIE